MVCGGNQSNEDHMHFPSDMTFSPLRLSQVAIVGAAGKRAKESGHDLTYMAESGLVGGLDLPWRRDP